MGWYGGVCALRKRYGNVSKLMLNMRLMGFVCAFAREWRLRCMIWFVWGFLILVRSLIGMGVCEIFIGFCIGINYYFFFLFFEI